MLTSARAPVALSTVVASVVPAVAQPYGPGMGWGGGYWPLGMFIWPVILVGLIVLGVWAVRSMSAPHPQGPPLPRRSPGLDVLEERYARGEIGRDEYLQKKADLAADG